MMRRVNEHFEVWIREKPGEWMCMKRRWPKPIYKSDRIKRLAATTSPDMSSPATAQ